MRANGWMLKGGISDELGQLHKTNALLIAAQFDVSDALAASHA